MTYRSTITPRDPNEPVKPTHQGLIDKIHGYVDEGVANNPFRSADFRVVKRFVDLLKRHHGVDLTDDTLASLWGFAARHEIGEDAYLNKPYSLYSRCSIVHNADSNASQISPTLGTSSSWLPESSNLTRASETASSRISDSSFSDSSFLISITITSPRMPSVASKAEEIAHA